MKWQQTKNAFALKIGNVCEGSRQRKRNKENWTNVFYMIVQGI
jgi:hypothetical protein